MTQEEKQLLLKDLCTRLIYMNNLKVAKYIERDSKISDLIPELRFTIGLYELSFRNPNVIIKPYLRPMSSMTEEEKEIYKRFCDEDIRQLTYVQEVHPSLKYKTSCYRSIDWLNEHHFDYRGLIGKGLALEAPEGMYEID